ncbi:MAG: hypothetical protein ACXVPX_00035 [Actinomycetota bacterium]
MRRILSLLVYAQSNDLVVPAAPIAELMMLGGYEAAPQPEANGNRPERVV